MIRLFLNGLGASAGAGLTYIYNLVPLLSAMPDVHTTLALQPHLRREFEAFPQVTLADVRVPSNTARRFWFEQHDLPDMIRKSGADVLISAGNFALRKSPVPQILLSGNSLYVSADFYRDLRQRNEYGLWLDTRVKGAFAKRSIQWADCTVAPTRAFADELERWTGREVAAIHHGFDQQTFFGDESPISEDIKSQLDASGLCLKLLFVSHYNYYRNLRLCFAQFLSLEADWAAARSDYSSHVNSSPAKIPAHTKPPGRRIWLRGWAFGAKWSNWARCPTVSFITCTGVAIFT